MIMNSNELVTKADIAELKKAIIEELHASLGNVKKENEYLRSADVRKMLNISDGTLQRLRISGTLDAKKVNGMWFYKLDNVKKMLDGKNEKA